MNNLIKRIHSNLYLAKDLQQTDQFYRNLGFDVAFADDTVRVKLGDFTLAYIDEKKSEIKNESGSTHKGLGLYTYIEVEDVDQYYNFLLKNGVAPDTEPKTWPWGKREFVMKDPDAFKLVFYSKA